MNKTENNKISALISKVNIDSSESGFVSDCLVEMMVLGADFPGFLSADMIPPSSENKNQWTLIQRFRDSSQLTNWRQSDDRNKLLAKVTSQSTNNNLQFSEEELLQHDQKGSASIAIVDEINPDLKESYKAWEIKIKSWQAKLPGYKGTFLQGPTDGTPGRWTTLLHFDRPEDLDNWYNADERKSLLPEAKQFIKSTNLRHLASSFPGWFPVDEKGHDPARWKTTMLVLLSLYPIASLLIKYFRPLLNGLPIVWINLCSNIISVSVMGWIIMPIALKAFQFWLYPKSDSKSIDIKGFLIVLSLYLVETALLSLVV